MMSDKRKILFAKRKVERERCNNFGGDNGRNNNQVLNRHGKGVKRTFAPNPKKNLANDRLKKLRTSLNEQIDRRSEHQSQKSINSSTCNHRVLMSTPKCNSRKRSPNMSCENVLLTKVPKFKVCDSNVNIVKLNSPLILACESASTSEYKSEDKKNMFTKNAVTDEDNQKASLNFPVSKTNEEIMDWSPSDNTQSSTTAFSSTSSNSPIVICNDTRLFYIVVDTNIFISQINIIKTIVEMNITGNTKPVIYIPWMVIEELDCFKDDPKHCLRWEAREAVKYIEKTLADKNEKMMGQSLNDVNRQGTVGKNPDNKIIACCLQIMEKQKNMILLTNDINLKNKAHINSIPVCSHEAILNKLSLILNSQTKSKIILEKMTCLCNIVIKECASRAYGKASNKMPITQHIPKTIQDCFKIFTKYWFSVFQELLMKQFKKSIGDLSSFLTHNSIIKDDSKELNDLLRLCVRVCIFLKDIDFCKNAVENTICEMNDVGER